MKVITRGNVKAEGLPKIYIAGHPEDMEIHLKEIEHRLFLNGSYALYPFSTEHEKEEGFPYFLSEMQLVVIIVTEKFLRTENAARCSVFRYASEQKIPILPLQMEAGIEQEFNNICGTIHCLDLTRTGMEAVSNEKKLSDYLGNVLADERMIQDIKDAFIGYIFLSYRQKDWKQGQALMRLLHKSPQLRDVAIWYDGYLTFGKEFNTAIFDKLHNCSLVALVVTPNLLEEGNYVKEYEYPEAVNPKAPFERKVVLPIEMVQTDRVLLENAYENIPACFTPDQMEEISRFIEESLEGRADYSKREAWTHKYLVAMAYHFGINVEMNKDLALELFIDAAEEGSMDAAKKLVDIYRRGDGRKINYVEAFRWQYHLLNGVKYLFQKEASEQSLSRVLEALYELLELYVEVQDLKSTDEVLVAIDKWIESGKQLLPEEEYYYYRARFGLWSGRYLVKADQINRECDHDGMGKSIVGVLNSAREFGILLVSKHPYERNINLLLEIEFQLAEFYASLGKYKEALGILTANLEAYRSVYEGFGDEESLNKLQAIYTHVGEYGYRGGELKLASVLYDRALRITQAFREYGETYFVNEAGIRMHIADVEINSGNIDAAMENLNAAHEILEQHFVKTKDYAALRILSRCLDKIGNLKKNKGKLDDAMHYYKQALEYDIAGYNRNKTDVSIRDVAVSYMKIGEVLMRIPQFEEAIDYFDNAIEWYKVGYSNAEQKIGQLNAKKGIAHSLNKKGQIYKALGLYQMAADHFVLSIQNYKELMEESDDVDYLESYAIVNYYMGVLLFECNMRAEGRKFLQTAYDSVLKQNSFAANVRSVELEKELRRWFSL